MNTQERKDSVALDRSVCVKFHEVSKRYPGTLALDKVSMQIRRGEIHALIGGNGSGKSTAVKILAGVVQADGGDLEIGGIRYSADSHDTTRARELGLRFVHQQDSVFQDLTVAENLSLGHGFENNATGIISRRRTRKRCGEVLDRFDIGVDPDTEMRRIRPATQMMVAIARALQDSEVDNDLTLVLDEPTASLPRHEVDILLDALGRYAAMGQTVVLVTHRLHEVMQVADAATVLRDGKLAERLRGSEITHERLVQAITGRALEMELAVAREKADTDASARDATQIEARNVGRRTADFKIRGGEVTGLAGLLGSGRSSLLKALYGLVPTDEQEVSINGSVVRLSTPTSALRSGVAYVPEDRADSLFSEQSIARNLSIAALSDHSRNGLLSARSERSRARDLMKSFSVRAASELSRVASLSGGNAQKVVLARWLQREPRLILLDEPTQGVDVGARAEIHRFLRIAASRGAAVAVVSSDFEELEVLADRILVVKDGKIVTELVGDDITARKIDSVVYSKTTNSAGGNDA